MLLYYSRPNAQLAPNAALGFSTQHTPHGDWRVYGAMVGDNVVQLAQPMSVRDHLAALMAGRTILPLLILLPLLALIVWLVVGRGLLPLRRFAHALDTRRPDALEPLPDTGLPLEIRPLAAALNGLLGRLGQSLDVQKAFVADAAHELRTTARGIAHPASVARARARGRRPYRGAQRSQTGRRSRDAARRTTADARARGTRHRCAGFRAAACRSQQLLAESVAAHAPLAQRQADRSRRRRTGACRGRGRPRSPARDAQQSARQRRQVHPRRRPHRRRGAVDRSGRRAPRAPRDRRQRSRDPRPPIANACSTASIAASPRPARIRRAADWASRSCGASPSGTARGSNWATRAAWTAPRGLRVTIDFPAPRVRTSA